MLSIRTRLEYNISARWNRKEGVWEVVVDFGKYGKLFHSKKDALVYAIHLQDPIVLELNLDDSAGLGLKKL